MKIVGRIAAALIAGVISVLMVQQFIKKVYTGFGKKYVTLPPDKPEELP